MLHRDFSAGKMLRKILPAQITPVGEDEVDVILSTAALARDGHILVPQGCIADNYRLNPVWFVDHEAKTSSLVGNAENITINADNITARIRFVPLGISQKADETRGLVKSGFLRAVSIGFDPLDGEPLDAKKPRGGQRITKWELLEGSFVGVPADTGAVVTARAKGERDVAEAEWKVGTSRDLPIEDSDAWDGGAAEASIFEWAGGDDFDPSKARKGFLFYNAAKPKERGSYKDPIAHIVDGRRLKVPKGAIRAAASRLPQTDVPDDVKKKAQGVLDHYKEKAGMTDDRGVYVKHQRALERAPSLPVMKRGLYEVANLAYQLEQLGYCHACSEWEAEIEGDDSKVPAMLGEALVKLGEAFIAMATEEATELLDGKDLLDDEGVIEIDVEERAYIDAAKTPRVRAWRRALAMVRAGKVLSKSNSEKLENAQDHHDRAAKKGKEVSDTHDTIGGALEKARSAHTKMTAALTETQKNPSEDGVERAMKHAATIGDHLDGMADGHADIGDAHRACMRAVTSAAKCVRSVLDGATTGEDSDSKDIQGAGGGDKEDEGSRQTDDFWQREAARLRSAA